MMQDDAPEIFQGGCHCGAVRYRVTVRSRHAVACNCTICKKKGYLHLIVAEEDFDLLSGADAIETYTFGTHTAKHHFCRHCGIHSYYRPRSHPERIDVNIHCLEGIEPSDFDFYSFDGRHWEDNVEELRANQRSDH